MTKRVYAMTRIRQGDYLLPSNDGRTLWRITSYLEDGSATYGDTGRPVLGTFWEAHRFTGDLPLAWPDDVEEWIHWRASACGFRTRREAVEYALTREEVAVA